MLTDALLEFFRRHLGQQLAVLRQGLYEAAPQRVEYQAIGNGVHEPARNGTDAGKGLEAVSGDSQCERQCAPDAALAQAQELLDIQVTRGGTVQSAQLPGHRRTDISLDQDVRTRADRCHRADYGLASRASNDLLRLLPAILTLGLRQPRCGHAKNGTLEPHIERRALFDQESIDRDDEYSDVRRPLSSHGLLLAFGAALDNVNFATGRDGNNVVSIDLAANGIDTFQ